jgi:hypothetical protein
MLIILSVYLSARPRYQLTPRLTSTTFNQLIVCMYVSIYVCLVCLFCRYVCLSVSYVCWQGRKLSETVEGMLVVSFRERLLLFWAIQESVCQTVQGTTVNPSKPGKISQGTSSRCIRRPRLHTHQLTESDKMRRLQQATLVLQSPA